MDSNKDNVIDKNEIQKIIEILFDLTMKGDSEVKKPIAVYNVVKMVTKKFEKMNTNRDDIIKLDTFVNACIEDKIMRSIMIDPFFNSYEYLCQIFYLNSNLPIK